MIRVFPRKTKWTPDDDMAFIGDPPLYIREIPKDTPVYVSVAFTWDIEKAQRLVRDWSVFFEDVKIGGPAITKDPGEFVAGRFIKEGVTITSRGCPKSCPWCQVPKMEGHIKELPIVPGHIVQDNNLLACSDEHIREVFDMLREQRKGAIFSGGLDIKYLKPWHVDMLKSIRIKKIWVAFDTLESLGRLTKARDLLADFKTDQKHAYVMVGRSESLIEAEKRLEAVYDKEAGFLPFAQFYRPVGKWTKVPEEWRYIHWKWQRPREYRIKKSRGKDR